jgi:hypothetical protein
MAKTRWLIQGDRGETLFVLDNETVEMIMRIADATGFTPETTLKRVMRKELEDLRKNRPS